MKYILRRECLIWSVHKKRTSFLIGTAYHLYTPKLALLFITIPIGRELSHLCHRVLTWISHLDYEFACYQHLDDGLPWSCITIPIGRKLTHLCHGMLTWISHLDCEFACYRHLDDGLPWSCLENPCLWCIFIILRDVHLDFNYILVI